MRILIDKFYSKNSTKTMNKFDKVDNNNKW